MDILSQHCVTVSSVGGHAIKPKEKPYLILYIKDLNIVKPDKWGTSELTALLHQILTYDGYYDEKLEWYSLKNIQVCILYINKYESSFQK